MLRNLEDERMRMVRPHASWSRGWWHLGHPGDTEVLLPSVLGWSCRGGQRKDRVGLAGKHLKSSRNGVLLSERCWCRGGSQVCRDGEVKPVGVWGLWEGFHGRAAQG